MFPKITFVGGTVVETNFDNYEFLRMKDAPLDIEVKFIESDKAPMGLGEPALSPVAALLRMRFMQPQESGYANCHLQSK